MKGVEDRLRAALMSGEAARSRAMMFARVDAALRGRGIEPSHRFHVPGRIEVLGKHTDYAGGRSLLVAVEKGFCVVSAPRADAGVRILDVGRDEEVMLSLDPSAPPPDRHWAIYPAAVTRRLVRDFAGPLCGADIALLSDLPPSSGLSSSSVLLIATFEALRAANLLETRDDFARALPDVLDVAAYLGSVESGRPFRGFGGEAGVGTAGGSQDHTAILASEAGRLRQFGFAPVRAEGSVVLPGEVTFVVAVSGVVAQKTAGAREAYNRAAALSAAILQTWRAISGRDDRTLFEAVASSSDAQPRLRQALASATGEFPAPALLARLDQFVDEKPRAHPDGLRGYRRGRPRGVREGGGSFAERRRDRPGQPGGGDHRPPTPGPVPRGARLIRLWRRLRGQRLGPGGARRGRRVHDPMGAGVSEAPRSPRLEVLPDRRRPAARVPLRLTAPIPWP